MSASNETENVLTRRSVSEKDVEVALGNPLDRPSSTAGTTKGNCEDDDMKCNLLWCLITIVMELLAAQMTFYFGKTAFSEEMNKEPSLPDLLHDSSFGVCDQGGFPMNDPNNKCVGTLSQLLKDGPDRLVVLNLIGGFALGTYNGIRSKSWRRSINLGAEYLFLHSILMTLRCLTINVTTLPAPSPLCRNSTSTTLPPDGWFITQIECNDSLYSGHCSVYTIIMVLFICSYLPNILKAAWFFFYLFCCFISCVTADHYTVDVVVAMYLSFPVCLWLSSERLVNIFGKKAYKGFNFTHISRYAQFLREVDAIKKRFDV